ncbi:energy transducer TonB [Paraflavisolibacter sp. H34]|uniref:energy transducer TonB n=1 Tax=Huijunlia imazamoxiresistens TaxID=3127457 RepID=UPI003016A5F1
MKKMMFSLFLLAQAASGFAQKQEEVWDNEFKPTTTAPRYLVRTEKKGDLWYRALTYLPERTLAREGTYLDAACKLPHGTVSRYYPDGTTLSSGLYQNGKKEGVWKEYNEAGQVTDSAGFKAGRVSGVQLKWYKGLRTDSLHFDGAGNGVHTNFQVNGKVFSQGSLVADTLRVGRWNYYHANGQLLAVENYVQGERASCDCFDEQGKQRAAADCKEQEAQFPEGLTGWSQFLGRNLRGDVPVKKKAPAGAYTVMVQFIVNTEGRITDMEPLTHYGFGMEQEVLRILRLSPRWTPAWQYGRKVNAYRRQPITFVISEK